MSAASVRVDEVARFDALAEDWWEDEAKVETLCALATWRRRIDESGEDPREELDFHRDLALCRENLGPDGGIGSHGWGRGRPTAKWRKLNGDAERSEGSDEPERLITR